MIEPTIGRVVWYFPHSRGDSDLINSQHGMLQATKDWGLYRKCRDAGVTVLRAIQSPDGEVQLKELPSAPDPS